MTDADDSDRSGRGNYHAAALARGLSLLQLLADARAPLGLPELHERSELPKSTLVRLLTVLDELGYVTRVDERPSFWLGPAVMPLAEAYGSALDVSDYAAPVLRRLADSSRQTANLGVLDGTEVVHLCVVEPDRPLRFRASTGSRDGAYHTGLGKLLLAYLPAEQVTARLPQEPFPARTDRTIRHRAELDRQLALTRRRGYAFDDGEGDPGVRCLAVPLTVDQRVVAALSVTGAAGELARATHAEHLDRLRRAAEELGGDPRFQAALSAACRSLA